MERWKNCRVLIRDSKTGALVADTTIIDYDYKNNSAKIRPSSLRIERNEIKSRYVTALIFGERGLYEYSGILRPAVVANELQVVLFSGKEKENREHGRYELKAQGQIEAVYVEHQKIVLQKPIELMAKNISRTGILLQTMSGSMEVGDCVHLRLYSEDVEIRGDYQVMRKQNETLWTEEYGCRRVGARNRR